MREGGGGVLIIYLFSFLLSFFFVEILEGVFEGAFGCEEEKGFWEGVSFDERREMTIA